MGLFGAIAGGAIGLVTGGPVGAVVGAAVGYGAEEAVDAATAGGGGGASAPQPQAVDYSAALMIASENSKTTALGQIHAQMMALQQSSMDRELQKSASLELSLEKFDTKLQVSRLGFLQSMSREENQHVEKMAEAQRGHQRIVQGSTSTYAASADFSPPDLESNEPREV